MKRKLLWALGGFWMVIVVILLLNSSRWAPAPDGRLKMIAHRGIYHQFNRTNLGRNDCTATRMLPGQEKREIFENTIHSLRAAVNAKADMIEVDVALTKDGEMVLFHDWTVDCRTNGKGETRNLTLEELRALDIGHGYTSDDGATYPLRGKGFGKIPTVEEALAAETYKPFLFNFKSDDPKEADRLAAILKAAGRDPVKEGDGFYGADIPTKRMAELFPGVWTWTKQDIKACAMDYIWMGWLGMTPDSCTDSTLFVPLNYQWAIAGWPNRTIKRMEDAGARIIIIAPIDDETAPSGIMRGDQLGDIPGSYNGYIMVEDIASVGPALIR